MSSHKNAFIEGILSEIIEKIKNKELENKHSLQELEVKSIQNKNLDSPMRKTTRESTLMKADNFLGHVVLHSTSGDPNIMVRRVMRTSSSDSDVLVTGLEIWIHMAVTYAGSAQTQ